jgi:23S rRNA pseudouridine1911/1915/1917 synthase
MQAEMVLKILYEDNHLISIEKSAGIPVQKDSSGDIDVQNSIKEYLKRKYSKHGNVFLGIVHRLDRPVGGVMVFAKTSKAASRLSDQIRKGVWKKKYLAVIDGVPEEKKGRLEDFLTKDRENNLVSVVSSSHPGAKPASLEYRTIMSSGSRTIVEIDLETGRSHQIRVQFASRGLPVVNDHRYNVSGIFKGDICLWAYSLEINHPVSGEKLVLRADMPRAMVKFLFEGR